MTLETPSGSLDARSVAVTKTLGSLSTSLHTLEQAITRSGAGVATGGRCGCGASQLWSISSQLRTAIEISSGTQRGNLTEHKRSTGAAMTRNCVTSTCPVEAPEDTPSRREVERSCEGVYAAQSVSWADWSPSEALWTACLSPAVCAQARMCRRQRMRRMQIHVARRAAALARRSSA